MNRANQLQIIQEANMGLIDIRQQELSYFSSFFDNFGINALFMAGFMIGALSQQNPGPYSDSNAPYPSLVFYWLSCALCAATGVYTLCGASMIQIFGQNLAIRGPAGSMVIALEGMLQEQHHVVWACLLTAFFFICQADGMFWFRMDQISAISTSAVLGFFIFVCYDQLLRMYNKFNYSKKRDLEWDNQRTISKDLRELRPSIVEDIATWMFGRPSIDLSGSRTFSFATESPIQVRDSEKSRQAVVGANNVSDPQKYPLQSPLPPLEDPSLSIRKATYAAEATKNFHQQHHAATVTDIEANDEENQLETKRINVERALAGSSLRSQSIFVGGALTVRSRHRFTHRSIWRRRFVIVKDNHVYFYRNRRSFALNPMNPMNPRPIDLEGYTLVASSNATSASQPESHSLSLAPIDEHDVRKIWKFRCDTISEFNRWVELLMLAIAVSNPHGDQQQFVKFSTSSSVVDRNRPPDAPGAESSSDDD